jgi:hypothetical protein
MGKKQIGIEQVSLLNHDLFAKQSNTRASINDYSFGSTGDLKASGVTAILDGIGTRARYTSPRTPKLELE